MRNYITVAIFFTIILGYFGIRTPVQIDAALILGWIWLEPTPSDSAHDSFELENQSLPKGQASRETL